MPGRPYRRMRKGDGYLRMGKADDGLDTREGDRHDDAPAMSTQRPAQLSELFHSALARDPSTRDAFLDEACRGDDGLRHELARLLAGHAEAGSFLQEPIGALANDRFAPGTRLGSYSVSAFIGAGGMGEVYRATDTRLGRDVALKVLPREWSADAQRRQRFEREARAVAALNHPNICTIHDVGHSDGFDYLVMELLDGDTLAGRLVRGSLPHAEVLSIATQIGDALDAAHRAGIVHRDLKPANIMLKRAGASSAGSPQAKLLDFGLSRPVFRTDATETTQASLTGRGDLLGTLPYMAPEQLEGRQVDARADIWAFGCVLYEMVSGRRAFTASSDARLISAILTTEPPALTSSPLDRLIRKCLAKDPDRRWQTAADLTDELRWIGGWSGESVSPAPVADAAKQRRVLRWRLLTLVAAGLAVAAVGIAAGYFLHPSPELRLTRFDFQPPPGTTWGEGLAISPDGRRVAFVAVSGGKSSIWVRDLADTRTRQLDGTDGADFQLFWSPDSVSLGFFAGGKLKTIPADGGPVLPLADAPSPGGGTWNRDGVIVFSPEATRGLQRVRADGGPVAELTTVDAGIGGSLYRFPVFLPDGRHLLYRSKDGVFATSLDNPGRRVRVLEILSSVQVVLDHLLFVRNGSLWAQPFDVDAMAVSGEATRIVDAVASSRTRGFTYEFSASETGVLLYRTPGVQQVRQFAWLDRSGRELSRVPVTGALAFPDISPDGMKLAFSMDSSGNRDIHVLDLDHPVPRRLTFHSEDDDYPLWSPDGSRIAFSRDVGRKGLFEINADGQGSERELLPPGAVSYADSYARDGHTLLVSRQPQGGNRGGLFMLSLDGEPKLVEFLDTPTDELHPRLSRDNRWVSYLSLAKGDWQVYVERYPSRGGMTHVANRVISTAKWRADGNELFYVGRDNHLMAVPMKDGVPTGLPVSLFEMGGNPAFVVAKDGQRFLINVPATGSDAKTTEVLVNWPALLKR